MDVKKIFNMSNKTYDRLKWVICVGIYATTGLIIGLGKIWGLPYVTEIAGTLSVIGTFLGSCLQISSSNYTPKAYDSEADEDDWRLGIEVRDDE